MGLVDRYVDRSTASIDQSIHRSIHVGNLDRSARPPYVPRPPSQNAPLALRQALVGGRERRLVVVLRREEGDAHGAGGAALAGDVGGCGCVGVRPVGACGVGWGRIVESDERRTSGGWHLYAFASGGPCPPRSIVRHMAGPKAGAFDQPIVGVGAWGDGKSIDRLITAGQNAPHPPRSRRALALSLGPSPYGMGQQRIIANRSEAKRGRVIVRVDGLVGLLIDSFD